MITIFEGPDATGKTSLARSDAFADHSYVHQGPFTNDVLAETLEALWDRPSPLACDRLHIGEHVYGPILRGVDTLNAVRHRVIDRYLLSRSAVVVLALPSLSDAIQSFQRTRQVRKELVSEDAVYRLTWHAYHQLPKSLPTVRYDFVYDEPDGVRLRVEAVRPPKNEGPGVGMFKEGVTLLVGEQTNPRAQGRYLLPFIGTGYGAGSWLTALFEDWRVPETSLYWANAKRPDGGWEDPSFIDALRPSRIVAMGRVAQGWLKDVEHVAVPHPQYWRRFRTREKFEPMWEAICTP